MDKPIFKFAIREDLQDVKEQFLPKKGEPLATGWDVFAAFLDRKPFRMVSGEYVKIPLGFRVFCPENYWYELKPRSSTFAKKKMHALYGTIDESYPSELIFAAQYLPQYPDQLEIAFGEAIGQIIPVKRQEMIVEDISNEEIEAEFVKRNAVRQGGFGSTG